MPLPMRPAFPLSHRLRSTFSAVTLAFAAILLGSCGDATGVAREKAQLTFVRSSPYDTILVANPETWEIEQEIPLPMAGIGVRMSPTGDRVAVTTGARDLWVMNADGSDARVVATGVYGMAWSRDGTRLAYGHYPGPELRIVNADGSGDVVVPGAVPGGYSGIAWAPDGRRIAFEGMRGASRTIYVVNVDGSGLRDIDLTLPGPEIRSSGEPTWSPDGRKIAFSRHVLFGTLEDATTIWVATLATREARSITTNGGLVDVRPAWSPDGSRIAFLRFRGDRSDVFVVRPNGTDERQITDTPDIREEYPQWVRP